MEEKQHSQPLQQTLCQKTKFWIIHNFSRIHYNLDFIHKNKQKLKLGEIFNHWMSARLIFYYIFHWNTLKTCFNFKNISETGFKVNVFKFTDPKYFLIHEFITHGENSTSSPPNLPSSTTHIFCAVLSVPSKIKKSDLTQLWARFD